LNSSSRSGRGLLHTCDIPSSGPGRGSTRAWKLSTAAAAAVAGVLAVALPTSVGATEADANVEAVLQDSTARPLAEAQRLLRQQQFEEALTALQEVDSSGFSPAAASTYSRLIAEAETGAAARRAARATFDQGQQAFESGDLVTALARFGQARDNSLADDGTRSKAAEQAELALANYTRSGRSLAGLFDEARADFDAGRFESARTKFEALQGGRFRAPLFQRSPAQYIAQINAPRVEAARTVATETTVDAPAAPVAAAPVAVAAVDEPLPAAPVVVETTAAVDAPVAVEVAADPRAEARLAYQRAAEAYRKNDLTSARLNYQRAAELGYRTRLFETGPSEMVARIDRRLEEDARRMAVATIESSPMEPAAIQATDVAAEPMPLATPVVPPGVVEITPGVTPTPVAPVAVTPVAPTPAPVAPVAVAPAEIAPVVVQPVAAAVPEPASSLQATASAERLRAEQRAFEARVLVEEAGRKRESREFDSALQLYNAALEKDPANADAVTGRNAMLNLTGRVVAQDSDTRFKEMIEARRGAIQFSYNTAIEQSKMLRAENNFEGARNALIKAEAARDSDAGIFSPAEIAAFDSGIASEKQQIAEGEKVFQGQQRELEARRAADEQRTAQLEESERRRRTVSALRGQAIRLTEQEKYKEALAVIDQILTIDPNDDYASGVRIFIQDKVQLQRIRNAREQFTRSMNDVLIYTEESRIPVPDILKYPSDWPDISARRDETVALERGGLEEARIEELLSRRLPEVRFTDVPFRDVIEYLVDTTQANIFVNWPALEGAGVDPNAPVSLRLRNVPFRKVLQSVLDIVGGGVVNLGYTVDEGVITVSTGEELARNTATRIYLIRDLLVVPEDFSENAPNLDISRATRVGGGGGGQSIFSGGGGGTNSDREEEREELIEQIVTLITETISSDSWRDNGGLIGSIQPLDDQLIITQTPETHRDIDALFAQLRELRAVQVNIEARFITVQRNFLEEVGIDFDFQFNVDYGNFPIDGIDPDRTVDPINTNQNGFNFTAPGSLGTGITGNLAGAGGSTNVGSGTDPVTGSTTAIGIYLDNFRANLLLRSTQLSQRATSLSAPRITLRDGGVSYIGVSTDTAYVSDLDPIVATGVAAFDPQIGIASSGVALLVSATVSADRKYVTLSLRPQRSRLIGFTEFAVTATITGDGEDEPDSFLTGRLQQPTLENTTLETQVTIPDGGTLLLGGQTLAADIERESGTPVLSKVPFLKRLFTNTGRAQDEFVLLILVKPTIIIQREIEQETFPMLNTR
jgi:general secretion pathway protein D